MDVIISAVTQRTGSTLVQRIFNARPKTLIWGEHGGVLSEFQKIYDVAKFYAEAGASEREDYFGSVEDPNLWTANMSPGIKHVERAIHSSVKAFFDQLYAPYREEHDLIGFKEVRYGEEIPLFRRCYPDCHIVYLVRHPIDIWDSMHRSVGTKLFSMFRHPHNPWDTLNQLIKRWNRNVSFLLKEYGHHPRVHLLRYEDILRKDKKTLSRLSELAKVTPEQIDNVLSVKLSSTATGISIKDKIKITQRCKENMKKLGY